MMWVVNAFLSAFFGGITAILSKLGLENVSSHYVTAVRSSLVLILTYLLFIITGSSMQGINNYNLIFIVLSGIATGASWLCYYRALSLADVSQVAPVDKLSTFITILFACLLFHEEMTWLKGFCILIMFVGTYLMQQRQMTQSQTKSWIVYALGSAVFASLTAILAKIGIGQIDTQAVTLIRTIVVVIMAWIVVGVSKSYQSVTTLSRKQIIAIVFSALATGLSWLCYFAALKEGPASLVVPIDKLSFAVSILFAYLVLHEKQNLKTMIGIVLIVSSTLLLLIS